MNNVTLNPKYSFLSGSQLVPDGMDFTAHDRFLNLDQLEH
jgi:hypothetical protein